jgi:hypothetical protein
VNTKNNDETNDFFGTEMLYDSLESGLNTKSYYNGNLSAVKWKGGGAGTGTTGQHLCTFQTKITNMRKFIWMVRAK